MDVNTYHAGLMVIGLKFLVLASSKIGEELLLCFNEIKNRPV